MATPSLGEPIRDWRWLWVRALQTTDIGECDICYENASTIYLDCATGFGICADCAEQQGLHFRQAVPTRPHNSAMVAAE